MKRIRRPVDTLPPPIEAAIGEAIRRGPGKDAPPLVQLAWIYGEGTKIVLDACRAYRRQSRWRRWLGL